MSAIPITLTGTIATAPAARTLPSGRACASFRLAVNHWRIDKDTGEFIDDGTSWFSVDCYGDLASNSSMTLQPGTAVIVTGSLKIRQWDNGDRSGIAPTVVADHIGPDLRYGTAHYRRSKAPDRGQNQGKQATDSESSPGDGWDGLESQAPATPAGSDVERNGYSTSARSAYSVAEADDDDAEQSSAVGDGTGAADVGGAGVDATSGAESASDSDEDAIARETAAAAAPF